MTFYRKLLDWQLSRASLKEEQDVCEPLEQCPILREEVLCLPYKEQKRRRRKKSLEDSEISSKTKGPVEQGATGYFACSPEEFCEYFFVFAWEFCIEKWRGFLVIFFWSPFPTKRGTKTPQKIRENSEQISGKNSGQKLEKFGELSFCNFLT